MELQNKFKVTIEKLFIQIAQYIQSYRTFMLHFHFNSRVNIRHKIICFYTIYNIFSNNNPCAKDGFKLVNHKAQVNLRLLYIYLI